MNSIKNKKLVYTFFNWHKKCFHFIRTLELPYTNKIYIANFADARRLAKHVSLRKYKTVIGFADARKNSKRNKIETCFQNLYGRSKIIKNGIGFFKQNLIFELQENDFFAKSPSNGPCNRTSYLIMNEIYQRNLNTKFAFVHLSINQSIEEAKKKILFWLNL